MSHLGQHRDDAVEESEGFADTVVTQETEPATDEQVLRLCQKAGLVKLGHVSLDGTKVGANASKHKAMSYERMLKTAEELGVEVEALLERAETVDSHEDARLGKDVRGDELPFELQRKKTRLRRIAEAKAGRAVYARKKAIVEPVFGQIKQARGFRSFLLRGRQKVSAEWKLICTTHNLLKLYRALTAAAA